jgi:hypothetical protein
MIWEMKNMLRLAFEIVRYGNISLKLKFDINIEE